jgi:hypothetical protein
MGGETERLSAKYPDSPSGLRQDQLPQEVRPPLRHTKGDVPATKVPHQAEGTDPQGSL